MKGGAGECKDVQGDAGRCREMRGNGERGHAAPPSFECPAGRCRGLTGHVCAEPRAPIWPGHNPPGMSPCRGAQGARNTGFIQRQSRESLIACSA